MVSVVGHAAALLALTAAPSDPPKTYPQQLMSVVLIDLPPPPPPAEPVKAPPQEKPEPAKAPQRRTIFRPTPLPPPPNVEPMPAGDAKLPSPGVEMSDSQLVGASNAGTGPAGGGCNMPRLLQNALRKDRLVQAAVAEIHRGKAISIWNGGWVRHGQQEGEGLAAVRESIMWEVGFAPEACRSEPVHGLVVLSLGDGPGAPRIVLGAGTWRWTDLLFSRSGG